MDATGICSWSSAYRRFREWLDAGVSHEFWRQGLLAYDDAKGIEWNWLSLDGAMTKAPLGGERTGANPTDRGKDGTKRSLLTDGAGVPVGLTIDGANRNDHKLMAETIESIPVSRPRPTRSGPQGLCLDKGYDYDEARAVGTASGFTLHLRSRGEEKKDLECKPGVRARRWVVERTQSWMNRFRRILVRWEIREDTYFAMLHCVCGIVAWRASGLLK